MRFALALALLAQDPVTPKESCQSLKKNARYSAYFERVELEKLVQTISDATCRTFVMGENVKGKISIIGPDNGRDSLDAEQFYAVFLSALDADKKPTEELRVLPVRYAEAGALAEEVTRIVAPKTPKPGEVLQLTADERSNRIVMLSTAGLGRRAAELIAQLDVALPGDGKAHVYKLANAEAKELAANLTEVVAAGRAGAKAPGQGGGGSEPKISANESLNALVIVASSADYRNLVDLIQQL